MLGGYAFISLASAAVLFVLIVLILKSDLHSRSHQVAALLFFILFVWSLLDVVQRYAPSEEAITLAMVGIMALAIFIPPVLLHLSYIFPWKKRSMHPIILSLYGISFAILAIHINTRAFISRMELREAGYNFVPGDYIRYLLAYIAVLMFVSLLILVKRYVHLHGKTLLRKTRCMIAGVGTIVILTFSTTIVPILFGDYSRYPLTIPSFAVGAAVIIYGLARPLPDIPHTENGSVRKRDFPSGVLTVPKEKAYPMFYELLSSGMRGICLSGRKEEEIKEEIGIKDLPVMCAEKILNNMDSDDVRDTLYFVISDSVMDSGTALLMDSLESYIGSTEIDLLLNELKRMRIRGLVIHTEI